jgi:hypothetical protein
VHFLPKNQSVNRTQNECDLFLFLLLIVLHAATGDEEWRAAHHKHDGLAWNIRPDESRNITAWNTEAAVKSKKYNRTDGGLNDYDRDLVGKYYAQSKSVFEWGIVESTSIAVYVGVPRYSGPRYSGVDSDPAYITSVERKAPNFYRFILADIGPTAAWGNPSETTAKPKFPFYSAAVGLESKAFDFYMVDGRFRVACVCSALLHASKHNRSATDFVVAVHDFPSRYTNTYALIPDKLLTRVDGFDPENLKTHGPNLFIGRRKKGVSDETIRQIWYSQKEKVGR